MGKQDQPEELDIKLDRDSDGRWVASIRHVVVLLAVETGASPEEATTRAFDAWRALKRNELRTL